MAPEGQAEGQEEEFFVGQAAAGSGRLLERGRQVQGPEGPGEGQEVPGGQEGGRKDLLGRRGTPLREGSEEPPEPAAGEPLRPRIDRHEARPRLHDLPRLQRLPLGVGEGEGVGRGQGPREEDADSPREPPGQVRLVEPADGRPGGPVGEEGFARDGAVPGPAHPHPLDAAGEGDRLSGTRGTQRDELPPLVAERGAPQGVPHGADAEAG